MPWRQNLERSKCQRLRAGTLSFPSSNAVSKTDTGFAMMNKQLDFESVEMQRVLDELVRIEMEISASASAGHALREAPAWKFAPYRDRLIALKADLKRHAKHGALDIKRRAKTAMEQAWFSTPISHASSHFHLQTNAGPQHWAAGLSEVGMDISWGVSRLKNALGKV